MKQDILVEACCGLLYDVVEAQKAGADRIELNSLLWFGGLTPSAGTIARVEKLYRKFADNLIDKMTQWLA